jgi:hypothetical protein
VDKEGEKRSLCVVTGLPRKTELEMALRNEEKEKKNKGTK